MSIWANDTVGTKNGSQVTGTQITKDDGSVKRGMDVVLQEDANNPLVASNILYSDYQATLADTAEIDSGWLDMEKVAGEFEYIDIDVQ